MKKLLISLSIYVTLLALGLWLHHAYQRHVMTGLGTYSYSLPGPELETNFSEQPWLALISSIPSDGPPPSTDLPARLQAMQTLRSVGIEPRGQADPLRRPIPDVSQMFELSASYDDHLQLIQMLNEAPERSPDAPFDTYYWGCSAGVTTMDWTLRVGNRLYGLQEHLEANVFPGEHLEALTTHYIHLGTNVRYAPPPPKSLPLVPRLMASGITIIRPGPIWPLLILLGLLPFPLGLVLRRPVARLMQQWT